MRQDDMKSRTENINNLQGSVFLTKSIEFFLDRNTPLDVRLHIVCAVCQWNGEALAKVIFQKHL
jgi:hypothetical protein